MMEGPPWGEERYGLAESLARRLAYRAVQLTAVLLAVTTLLFILVRLSPSPAALLAGGEGATQAQVRAARLSYGLDGPISNQYLTFVGRAIRLDFGQSPAHQAAAMELVRLRLPATLLLASAVLVITALLAMWLGVWLGLRAGNSEHDWALRLLRTAQSLPALVAGLVLVQALGLAPTGIGGPLRFAAAAATLTWWLVPRAAQLTAGTVAAAARQTWVLTARSMGATSRQLLWAHLLPNSMLGALAGWGVQISFLLSAAVVVEWLFGWPGVGELLAGSVRTGDFPVVEASVLVIAMVVIAAYAAVDVTLACVDPRHRRAGAPSP